MPDTLSEKSAAADPIAQFANWYERARESIKPLPEAVALATASRAGHPSVRMVLLKEFDSHGFVFYTNYRSRKGRELQARPAACLVFQWSDLERQVRIDGTVQQVDAAASDAYYASRPLGARHSAWASMQSETVASRSVLEASMQAVRERHADSPPRPPHWGGYRVTPQAIEFWQGRADRLHDRLAYRRAAASDAGWTIERLAP